MDVEKWNIRYDRSTSTHIWLDKSLLVYQNKTQNITNQYACFSWISYTYK